MIFAHTLNQVLCGEKRQTRRLVKVDDSFDGAQQAIVKLDQRIVYKVGKSYAVQPNRGKKAVARILLTHIRRERVGDISEADAVDEGFQSRSEFLATWQTIHGQLASLECEVWVLEFTLHSLVEKELKVYFYEHDQKDESAYHSQNLSRAIQEISRDSVYSWDKRERGVGKAVSDRLPLLARTSTV